MTHKSRFWGAALVLLLLGVILSGCGTVPVAENWPGLSTDGATVFAISGQPQQVYLLDAQTGAQEAAFLPQGQHRGIEYWSPVTVGEEMAFVGFADSVARNYRLYAFTPETGQELWSVQAEDLILAAPVVAEGAVYFGSSDGRVYAVDLKSKSIKPGWPFEAEEAVWASPLYSDGRLYVAAMDHHLYCLQAETGEVVWDFQGGGAMAAQPVLDAERGILYVGAFDSRLYAVRADSGEAVEGFDFQAENWIWSEVLLSGDKLYVTSLDGRLYCLDPLSGKVIAPYPYDSREIANQEDLIRAAPIQAGENILVTTQSGRVIAVKDGVRQWYWPSGVPTTSILTTPVIAGDKALVLLANGQVQALDPATGVQGWAFSPPASQ